MTAQVEMFCSDQEEARILKRLATGDGCRVFDILDDRWVEISPFDVEQVRVAPAPLALYFWWSDLGEIRWFTQRPSIDESSHGRLVATVLAREDWNSRPRDTSFQLLDADQSPGVTFARGWHRNGKIGPSILLAPPSSLARVGERYATRVKRDFGWLRRQGRIVHDYRVPSSVLENPDRIVNTVYALQDVIADVKRGEPYALDFRLHGELTSSD